MTQDEADKLIAIMLTADGGCYHCAAALLDKFSEIWPEYEEASYKAYNDKFKAEDKPEGWVAKIGEERRTTTDGKPPVEGYENASAPAPIDPVTGQHGAYWVLSEEERKNGWVRPLRRKYKHKKCGVVTSMGLALCETYAKNPKFYSHTFCVGCSDHLPVSEFTWDEDGTEVGS